ncbi:hypothetical protein BKA69DRAFT_1084271 [Paraphysoderma sedebokerense]|nr:hypothetical protein BKA69DRAFT_1084271 [Paraphysoderma sedebokerense]
MTSGTSSRLLAILGGIAAGTGTFYAYRTLSGTSGHPKIKTTPTQDPPLNPKEFRPFTLTSVTTVSPNTSIFRFALNEGQKLNMPVASFVLTEFKDAEGKSVTRPYTPVSKENEQGGFELLIKKYENGPMSTHIHSLKPGDDLMVKGPLLKYKYEPNMHKEIGMIAGGTGITPMLQVVHKILDNPADKTRVSLIFGNISENDILLKQELDSLARKHVDRFRVVYTVDKTSTKDWKGEVGYVTKDMISKWLPGPKNENVKVFICGPPPMVKTIAGSKAPDYSQGELDGVLKAMGYSKDQVFKF